MSSLKPLGLAAALLAVPVMTTAQTYQIGRPITEAQVGAWAIDVFPNGLGLPQGKGSVAEGKVVYETRCAACHGLKGEGTLADRLVGGMNALKAATPVKTVGSYWPYATTVYEYVYRAMPYDSPKSLSPNEVYAVVAYILHMNGIVDAAATLDQATLAKVKMPNSAGFTGDPRPDVANIPCMNDCR